MTDKQGIRFIYFQLLPMGLLVGLIALVVIPDQNPECIGLVEALGVGFGIILLIIIFTLTLFAQVVSFFYKRMLLHRLTMLAMCAMLALLGRWLLLLPPAYFKAEVILEATNDELLQGPNLKLRSDGTYSATETQADWACTYHGNYKRSNDTIYLESYLMNETQGLFSAGYVLEPGGLLIPLDVISSWELPDALEIKMPELSE